MFPWLFHWAPQYHFPWSGSVEQDILPDTRWFFGAIAPAAGDGQLEKEIFEANSYGRQIGILSDVLMSQIDPSRLSPGEAERAIEQFKKLQEDVNAIKARYRQRRSDAAIRLLEQLQRTDPQELARIIARFRPVLDGERR